MKFLHTLFCTAKLHWLFFFILIIGSTVRLYHIRTDVIFIGDQARDFFIAKRMVTDGTIPLLGIPSSIPRFSQGPLFIYITAFFQSLFGFDPAVMAIVTAFLGILCIVLLYLLVHQSVGKTAALISTFLFALSPMAIIDARMPWVLSLIPFFSILYFYSLLQVVQGKSIASFFAGLTFALMFHNELATAPLLILLPLSLWLQKQTATPTPSTKRASVFSILGLMLGLLPQIIHDLTHNFSQLGGFSAWVVYRISSAIVPGTEHSLLQSSLHNSLLATTKLILTLFTMQNDVIFLIGWGLLLLFTVLYGKKNWSVLPDIGKLAYGGTVILILAFIIHGAPSQAYIPGLLLPMCILFGVVYSRCRTLIQRIAIGYIALALVISTIFVLYHNYFTMNFREDMWNKRWFGPNLETQKHILDEAQGLMGRTCMRLYSYEREETFPTHIAHFEYLLHLSPLQAGKNFADCNPIAIDASTYPKLEQHYSDMKFDLGSYWIEEMK